MECLLEICIWERETDRKIKTVCETETGLILMYYLGLSDLTGLDKSECVRERDLQEPGDAPIAACMQELFSCLPIPCRTGKKNTCLSLAVDCRQTLASRCVHRPGR